MAIITTPGAGVSPYETTTTIPTVLRASADGSTTLADIAATVDVNGAATASNSNVSVYVTGQEALNSLITTSQPGVFQGANVTINLEEQNFNTTNQVTSTTNYPAGNVGEIQYNSGANSFAGDPYFTYANGNVVTPGIRTDGYFFANGEPYTAPAVNTGNIGFSGTTMSGPTGSVNQYSVYIQPSGDFTNTLQILPTADNDIHLFEKSGNAITLGSYGESQLSVGGPNSPDANINVAVNSNTWTFDETGSLSLPTAGGVIQTSNTYPTLLAYGTNGHGGPELDWANTGNLNNLFGNTVLRHTMYINDEGLYIGFNENEVANVATPNWLFEPSGNLILPTGTPSINYANGSPYGGTGGSITLVPNDVTYQNGSIYGNANAGFTVVTTGDDDQSYSIPVDFPIEFLGNSYGAGNVRLVSNSYLTFGPDSYGNYAPVGPGVVSAPAIYVGATDLSNQLYYYGYADGTDDFVIGYEGSVATSGQEGYPSIQWELQVNSATPDIIKIVTQITEQSPGGIWGVSNGVEWVDRFQPLPWFSNYSGVNYNSIQIAPVTPQAATNIAFTGPGVTIGEDSGTTYVNINPFDNLISVGIGSGGEGDETVLSSTYYGMTLTTPGQGDDINITPKGEVRINGGSASNNQPGDGFQVFITGGNAHDNPNSPGSNSDGGSVNISGGTAVGNTGLPGQVTFSSNNNLWILSHTGGTRFPNLSVERGDNPSGTIQGQTLLFSDPVVEAIITTPNGPNVTYPNSQRLVINPGAGAANTSGEGGDIYLWAGRGGNASGSGGDIKIRGGSGGDGSAGGNGGDGGYIRIEAGDGYTTNTPGGIAGFIEMTAGVGGENQQGGYVRITGGQGGNEVDTVGGGDANITGGYGRVYGRGGNVNLTGGIAANGLPYYGRVNISSGASTWNFNNNGALTFPSGAEITVDNSGAAVFEHEGGVTIAETNGNSLVYNSAIELYDNSIHIGTDQQGSAYNWVFSQDGSLTVPGNVTGANVISANVYTAPGNVGITASGNTWIFNTNGNLTTPGSSGNINGADVITANIFAMTLGGNITEGAIPAYTSLTGNTIVLTPSGGTSADQQLVIYPTVTPGADANHLHLTSGNLYNTELFLGDDFLYVKLANTGNVVVNTNNLIGNSAQWTFGTNGNLTLPYGTLIKDTSDSAIAIGVNAGTGSSSAISIGTGAGNSGQSFDSIAIGGQAGANTQGGTSIAIGSSAGANTQGIGAVAIGSFAGNDSQGDGSIAIGASAGETSQGNNSIILNASGSPLNQTTANTFTVAPVRNDVSNVANSLYYNTSTFEVTYGPAGGAASVPGQNILPTIQSIAIANTSPQYLLGGGQGYANVTVSNVIPVTEYGVIITNGTSNQKYAIGALGNIPGTEQIAFTTGQSDTQFTVYAYVTSNAGTYYSNSATGYSGLCLLAGTQIALSDGSYKAIEDITYTDKLLSWDFDRGCYAETTALWIKRSETGSQYNLLTFSDGTTLRTFDQHRIFNKQAGAFTYPMTDATPIGTITVNEHGQEITLTNKQVIQDTIDYYNVITDHHMNLFSDSVLTSCRFNNIYPIVDMKFVKDNRTLRTRDEFANIPDRFFHGLRLTEQTADVETVEWYVDRLLATEVSTQAELVS